MCYLSTCVISPLSLLETKDQAQSQTLSASHPSVRQLGPTVSCTEPALQEASAHITPTCEGALPIPPPAAPWNQKVQDTALVN